MLETLKTKWANLQPRERLMLSAMAGVFAFLGLFVVVVMVVRAHDERREEIERYREALYYLEDHQDVYVRNRQRSEALRERLSNGSRSSVAAFLSKTATDLGFDVSVDPKKEQPASTRDTTGTMAQEILVTIREVERDKLLEYLWTIAHADAPLYIQHLVINRSRATGAAGGPDTPLSASVTVVAYRLDASAAP